MHLQLEPWFSGPASGCGFKDVFETSQNTYLHSGLYVSSRKCRDVIPSRAMQPQVCGAALPSSDFPCTPSPSTQDQAPDTHPLKPAAFLLSSETISASKERQQEGYDLKKKPQKHKQKETKRTARRNRRGKTFPYSRLWFRRGSWGARLRRVKCSRTDGTGCSPAACSLLLLIARRLIAPSLLAVC